MTDLLVQVFFLSGGANEWMELHNLLNNFRYIIALIS